MSATLDGQLDSRGTSERPEGSGHFTATRLSWDGTHVERVDAEIGLAPSGVAIDLRIPALAMKANALVIPRPPYRATMDASADGTTIAALVQALGERAPPALGRLVGAFAITAKATGDLDDLSTVRADGVSGGSTSRWTTRD